MTGRFGAVARFARIVALDVGAALGLVVLVGLAAGILLGIRPIVITSGSMEPTIDTGAVVLARTVPAADIEVGDVVTVPTATGSRVTHRVVAVDGGGEGAVLTLRGDANPAPDAEQYPVASADRMLVDVPLVGYVLAAMRSPVGLVVSGALAALLLLFIMSGGSRGGAGPPAGSGRHRGGRAGRRTLAAGVAGLGALSLATLPVVPSAAAWTDPVEVSGTTIAAHTVTRPASASCTSLLLSATVSWPADARYDYEVVLRRVSNGAVVSTRQVTGTDASVTYTGLTDFGLVVGAGTVDFQVEIRSYLAATPAWRAVDVRTYSSIQVLAVLVGATATCTT